MIANLLGVSGVDHVITIDLHASQMQGFFKCPVDNLVAEPLIARWIKHNVTDWKDGVVISKNPGGTKRVTSLADALKINFGIVTTDRRNPHQYSHEPSETPYDFEDYSELQNDSDGDVEEEALSGDVPRNGASSHTMENANLDSNGSRRAPTIRTRTPPVRRRIRNSGEMPSSPLAKSVVPGNSPDDSPSLDTLVRARTEPVIPPSFEEDMAEQFTDEVCANIIFKACY
jgi:ribose-phosphate pyrophosphokinase